MEDQARKLIANYWNNAKQHIPQVDTALAWFVEHKYHSCRNDRVLLDVRASRRPGRKKNWQIELLFRTANQQRKRAFFACHDSKHFTSYSLTLEDREFWFDDYNTALEFLNFKDAGVVA